MPRYLLEVIYEQVENVGANGLDLQSFIRSQVWSFENENPTIALTDARNELQRIIVEGLKLNGGAVIETTILPSSIKQIGLIDYDKYEEDASVVESGSAPTPAEMEVMAEPA